MSAPPAGRNPEPCTVTAWPALPAAGVTLVTAVDVSLVL
jgi:hypothetical protein